MSSLALEAGLDPRVVPDLDDDEFESLVKAVEDRRQEQAWTNAHEVMAAQVEALWAILARLEAGIAVVQVEGVEQAHDYGRYPRPDWIELNDEVKAERGQGEIIVARLSDLAAHLKGAPRD